MDLEERYGFVDACPLVGGGADHRDGQGRRELRGVVPVGDTR